jgi:hypothetical protein
LAVVIKNTGWTLDYAVHVNLVSLRLIFEVWNKWGEQQANVGKKSEIPIRIDPKSKKESSKVLDHGNGITELVNPDSSQLKMLQKMMENNQ